jgi:hypothetical protein
LAGKGSPWLDPCVTIGWSDVVRSILTLLSRLGSLPGSSGGLAGCTTAVRWLSLHTGVPALVVAAVLIAVGYRVLKRTSRFAVEVAAVTLALALASELGWLRW